MEKEKVKEICVFISGQDSTCGECGERLGKHAWIMLAENKVALCLSCAGLDHLEYLPAGDAALTRRARKHSVLWAVVLKWSRARKRYERQGLLVESQALEKAEEECMSDSEARERRRERDSERREVLDQKFIAQFAQRARELYPALAENRETAIAEHACQKYSGRVGRSAAAKALDDTAVRLAVIAHIRHAETEYDALFSHGFDRREARQRVEPVIDRILNEWKSGSRS